jgi:hypothetical protein
MKKDMDPTMTKNGVATVDSSYGLRGAIEKERKWYLEAFLLAEVELLKMTPPQSSTLEQVQSRISALKNDMAPKGPQV